MARQAAWFSSAYGWSFELDQLRRIDVRRDVAQSVDGPLQLRRQLSQPVQHCLGARVIALGFEGEEIAIQVPNGGFDLREIHRESSVAARRPCALLTEIVELQRH